MLRSGVSPIDERLGGLAPGRPHLLTGTTGAGKTAICLTFVAAGLEQGQSAAMLTQDDPRDLLSQASDLGLDLLRELGNGRFVLLRYQREFTARFARALSAEPVFDELVRLMGNAPPDRLVIDTVSPFLDGASASGGGTAALAACLDRLTATSLLTYPGDLRERYDRRLEQLVLRCAAVLHLSAFGEGVGRMDVLKARRRLWSEAPAFFSIRPGRGVIPLDDGVTVAAGRQRRQVLLFEGVDGLPQDFLTPLQRAYVVSPRGSIAAAIPEVLPPDVGALVVAARWDALDEATLFLRHLRHLGNRTPVLLLTRGDLRSGDRARALLAGFDEVVTDAAGADEFMARIAAVVRRGRSTTVPVAVHEAAPQRAASNGGSGLVDEPTFRATVESAAADGAMPVFTVLLLWPEEGELGSLAELVTHHMRAASGDLVGIVGNRVAVFLSGTRRADAAPFLRRVAEAWRRAGRAELRVTQLSHPLDGARLRSDLRLAASSVHGATSE